VERISRTIVVASAVLAGVTHAWLASGRPGIASSAAVTFVLVLALARRWLSATCAAVMSLTFVAPALTLVAFGASDYHTTLIWLSGIAGIILSRVDLSRWQMPARWAVPFAAWGLVIAVSWPIVAGREIDFSLIAARTVETTNAAYAAPPRLAAAWVVVVALSQLLGILWVDWLWGWFRDGRLDEAERFVLLPVVASAIAGAAAGLYQSLVDIRWANLDIWAGVNRPGGLMLDANTFGIGAAMWAPAAIAMGWRRQWAPWIGPSMFGVLAAAAWLSGSRTALLALAIGAAGVAVVVLRQRGFWRPRLVATAALVGALGLILAMALAPRGGSSASPLQRIFDRLPRLEVNEVRRFADELWTRFGYGRAAAEISTDYPVAGVGIGAFHIVATDYLYRDDPVHRLKKSLPTPDNAQNWWRHQIAELGFVGALPAVWISILILFALWRPGSGESRAGPATVLRAALTGVGVASLLGVPTQHPASWMSFMALLVWWRTLDGERPPVSSRVGSLPWLAGLMLAGTIAIGLALSARGSLRVAERARRAELPYSYGLSAPEGISEYGELRWSARHAVAVIPVPNRWLQLTVWTPPAAVASPVTWRVSVDERPLIEHTSAGVEPTTYYLEMPSGARHALLEIAASPAATTDRALQVATTWLRELPANAPSERVIRGSGHES
jgi:hypothetical protein